MMKELLKCVRVFNDLVELGIEPPQDLIDFIRKTIVESGLKELLIEVGTAELYSVIHS